MAIFRQYIAPLIVVLVFFVALVAVSARIFLPTDMAAPAPIEEVDQKAQVTIPDEVAGLPPSLEALVRGLPIDASLGTQL
jgi:hypothetical protein